MDRPARLGTILGRGANRETFGVDMTERTTERLKQESRAGSFEERAVGARQRGPLGEFAYFLRRSRKWWMTPIIVMLLLVGALLVMAGTAVGPLIYALF